MLFLFIQTTIFHATSKSKTVSAEISRIGHQDIHPGETENWSGDRLVIPPLPPSYLVGCSIIDINYYLEVNKYLYINNNCIQKNKALEARAPQCLPEQLHFPHVWLNPVQVRACRVCTNLNLNHMRMLKYYTNLNFYLVVLYEKNLR